MESYLKSWTAIAAIAGPCIGLVSVLSLVKPDLKMAGVFLLGCITPWMCGKLTGLLLQAPAMSSNIDRQANEQKHVYGLHHGVLSVELPPKSMWMNLGYWKNTQHDFPKACTQLLQEVLQEAGITRQEGNSLTLARNINIVDVGFGCGDQSLHLAELGTGGVMNQSPATQHCGTGMGLQSGARLNSYIGITLDQKQFDYAHRRLTKCGLMSASNQGKFDIFHSDAADPRKWSPALISKMERMSMESQSKGCENWLLGLDTLYHFSPSRKRIFDYAKQKLGASIMAFDLAFRANTSPSLLEKVLLRLFCKAVGAPYQNLMSTTEYRAQLQAAGYTNITMRDISEDVFGPLVRYLEERDAQLKMIGKGLGPLRVAGWVFKWWARTGLMGAYIVVARHPSE